eukprot:scaffold14691_cov152-Skeletonema_dohrnii-CCMP3373.AAC.2
MAIYSLCRSLTIPWTSRSMFNETIMPAIKAVTTCGLNQRYHLTGNLLSPIAPCIPSPRTPTQKTDVQTTESSSVQ